MIFSIVPLRRVAPNTNEQRWRSGLCERVIRCEATETEGLVKIKMRLINVVAASGLNNCVSKLFQEIKKSALSCKSHIKYMIAEYSNVI